jgi:hypothetical protein
MTWTFSTAPPDMTIEHFIIDAREFEIRPLRAAIARSCVAAAFAPHLFDQHRRSRMLASIARCL